MQVSGFNLGKTLQGVALLIAGQDFGDLIVDGAFDTTGGSEKGQRETERVTFSDPSVRRCDVPAAAGRRNLPCAPSLNNI